MNMLKTLALATMLTASTAGFALADSSALGALGSAGSVRFDTIFASQLLSANGASAMQQVDLDSLKSRIAQDPRLMDKLNRYGASLDDVVGITSSGDTDVRIYVLG
jgi:hypothetical protein